MAAATKSMFLRVMPLRLGTAAGSRNPQGLAAHRACREGGRMQRPTDLEEVMRFDPDEGIANLDEHLDRLKQSAEERGFKFDRHAARNELQAATFGKRHAAVVDCCCRRRAPWRSR